MWVMQAEQAEALSDEARALVEEQAGSLYGKTHNRSGACGFRAAYIVGRPFKQVQHDTKIPELSIDFDVVLMCCSVLNADSSDPLSVSMTGIDTELRR
jgi:hypothetical protein